MPLREVITEHPQYLAIAFVSWIAIGVWVMSLISWMIQGEIDGLFGLAGIGVAIALGYFSFMPPTEALRPFTAIAVVGTVVAFPVVRRALNDRELVAIDVEAMEDAYQMLREKPENHLQRFKFAKLLYGRGQIGAALAVGGEAIQQMPEKLFTEEHRMYARWKRQNPDVDASRPVACSDCGHMNQPAAISCQKCGQPHLIHLARGRWVGRQFARKLIAAWIASILALAGIPLASMLPPAAAIILVLAIVGGAVAMIWIAFRPAGTAAKA